MLCKQILSFSALPFFLVFIATRCHMALPNSRLAVNCCTSASRLVFWTVFERMWKFKLFFAVLLGFGNLLVLFYATLKFILIFGNKELVIIAIAKNRVCIQLNCERSPMLLWVICVFFQKINDTESIVINTLLILQLGASVGLCAHESWLSCSFRITGSVSQWAQSTWSSGEN